MVRDCRGTARIHKVHAGVPVDRVIQTDIEATDRPHPDTSLVSATRTPARDYQGTPPAVANSATSNTGMSSSKQSPCHRNERLWQTHGGRINLENAADRFFPPVARMATGVVGSMAPTAGRRGQCRSGPARDWLQLSRASPLLQLGQPPLPGSIAWTPHATEPGQVRKQTSRHKYLASPVRTNKNSGPRPLFLLTVRNTDSL